MSHDDVREAVKLFEKDIVKFKAERNINLVCVAQVQYPTDLYTDTVLVNTLFNRNYYTILSAIALHTASV